jgi:hypothetical protein
MLSCPTGRAWPRPRGRGAARRAGAPAWCSTNRGGVGRRANQRGSSRSVGGPALSAFMCGRGMHERVCGERKTGFAFAGVPSRQCAANSAGQCLGVLACNLSRSVQLATTSPQRPRTARRRARPLSATRRRPRRSARARQAGCGPIALRHRTHSAPGSPPGRPSCCRITIECRTVTLPPTAGGSPCALRMAAQRTRYDDPHARSYIKQQAS